MVRLKSQLLIYPSKIKEQSEETLVLDGNTVVCTNIVVSDENFELCYDFADNKAGSYDHSLHNKKWFNHFNGKVAEIAVASELKLRC